MSRAAEIIDLARNAVAMTSGGIVRRCRSVGRPRGTARVVLVLVAAAILLAAAGRFFLSDGVSDAAPDDQFISFHCGQCGHFFRLSHRQFEEAWDGGEFAQERGVAGLLLRCPECDGLSARKQDERAASAPAEP